MKTHSINLKPYQQEAAAQGRLGLVCAPIKVPPEIFGHNFVIEKLRGQFYIKHWIYDQVQWDKIKSPYAQGDVLVGREAWGEIKYSDGMKDIIYRENYDLQEWDEFRQSFLIRTGASFKLELASKMPLEYARYLWTITDVKPLWLPEITDEQARMCGFGGIHVKEHMESGWAYSHKKPFESWVWALSLEVKDANV